MEQNLEPIIMEDGTLRHPLTGALSEAFREGGLSAPDDMSDKGQDTGKVEQATAPRKPTARPLGGLAINNGTERFD